jgi:class 3 adenylate cyclase
VTLLFTDIEGSTRLLHELGDGYVEVLADHRRVLRAASARHHGVEVDTQGDAFFIAFPTASDAVAAARDAQRGLASSPVRVRMGLHTGAPTVTAEGYVGIDVHRGARICAAGHGGQVIMSKTTREALEDADVRDLGEHRLKDLDAPEWLFQLLAADLENTFPPLRTLSNTNLPADVSQFIGRGRELGELGALLRREDVRPVTLSGAGGSGKTRLAIQLGAEAVEQFKNGVFFIELAALTDPGLVLETVAQTLGATVGPAESAVEALRRHLERRHASRRRSKGLPKSLERRAGMKRRARSVSRASRSAVSSSTHT